MKMSINEIIHAVRQMSEEQLRAFLQEHSPDELSDIEFEHELDKDGLTFKEKMVHAVIAIRWKNEGNAKK